MRQGDGTDGGGTWSHNRYGDEFAAVYDRWYPRDAAAEACAAAVAGAARGGSVLELGAGTGRIALLLAERCRRVVAVDNSPAMTEHLLARAPSNLWVALGHMVRDAPDGPFDAVLCSENTLFNLLGDGEQRLVFAAVAARLAPGGSFLVECSTPPGDEPATSTASEVRLGEVVDSIAAIDPARREVSGTFTVGGGSPMRWRLRWSGTEELDAWATEHGMRLAARWSSWSRARFDASGGRHVSTWVLDGA
ncbi:MAG: class I SAM-dependent methyltransferase [Acidobacteria bacterium]|nr:class I SAM-dependent methyltransferase [Acidobacteriota bacterium]